MRGRLKALTLALLLLCTSCAAVPAGREGPREGEYQIYFAAPVGEMAGLSRNRANAADGGALDWEYRPLPDGLGEMEGLLALLLSGPERADLISPFPSGTAVRRWERDGGQVMVDLNEAYGGLSGADLTLADGCIVLTLCQLEGVDSVYLTVEGRPRPFRDSVLTPADFLLGASQG